MINREIVDDILSVVPSRAKACYTGQSILAYVDNPTFSWEEVNSWEDQTDVDIFCYTQTSQASVVQAYETAGYETTSSIEEFKSERIRFFNPSSKFSLQTVKLSKPGYPDVNISWRKGCEDAIDVIKNFDMDYLMVSMDLATRVFVDLRPENKRVAHVNPYNYRFDVTDVEPSYWYRQFERCPKGWSRGIDTRPVARQYAEWIKESLAIGDKAKDSKTRHYQNEMMEKVIAPVIETGFTREQAIALYHMFRGEQNTWEAVRMKHEAMLERIESWLQSVEDE